MDYSSIGFVRADKHRLSILESVKTEATKKEVSGRLRLPAPLVEKGLKELSERGLVKVEGDGCKATEKGLKILSEISKQMR